MSCQPQGQVLARVGPESITVEDFMAAAASRQPDFMVPADTARARLLDELIGQKLMLLEARRRNLDIDTVTKRFVQSARREEGLRALGGTFGAADVRVSEGEIARAWEWRKHESHVRLVFVHDERMVRAAYEELKRGVDFATVADRFNPAGSLPPGGDLGPVDPLRLPSPLDDAARTLPTGKVFGPTPIEGEGWALMVVTERTTAPTVPPLEELHDELRQILLQRKQRAMAVRGVQELIDGYQIRLAPSATSRLFERFNRQDVDPSVFDAGAGDDTVALATYQVNGRARDYTVKDALTDLAEGSEAPAWAMSEQIERWLRGQIMRRAAVLEAERRHLVEDPAVARRFQRRVDDYLIESVTDPLVGGLVASEEEMRAFYERLLQNAPPGSPAFEQLSPADLNQLHDLVVASHKREVLQQFQSQLRGQYPVTVDHAALARVRWPGPITFGQG